jgi:hypothetical protein
MKTMSSIFHVSATRSDVPVRIPNPPRGTDSLILQYDVYGEPLPDSLSLTLAATDSGGCYVPLDTCTPDPINEEAITRTVELGGATYDAFALLPSWTGGQKVSVDLIVRVSGHGVTYPNLTSATNVGG